MGKVSEIEIKKTKFDRIKNTVIYKKEYQKELVKYDTLLDNYRSIYYESSLGKDTFEVSLVSIKSLINDAVDYYYLPIDIDLKNCKEDWLFIRDYIINICNNELKDIVEAAFVTKSNGLHLWLKILKKAIGSEYVLSLFYLACVSYFKRVFSGLVYGYELAKGSKELDITELNEDRIVDNLVVNSDLTFSNKQITLLCNFELFKRSVNGVIDFKDFILKNQTDYNFDNFILETIGGNSNTFEINLDIKHIDELLRSNDGRGKVVRMFYYFYGNEYEIKLIEYLDANNDKLTSLQEKKDRKKELLAWLKNSKNKLKKVTLPKINKFISGKIKEKQLINYIKIDINGYLKSSDIKNILKENNKAILSGSTGLGKTTALVNYAIENELPSLLVVPNISIIMSLEKQFKDKIDYYFNTENHKEYADKIKYPNDIFNNYVYVITYEKFSEILVSPFVIFFLEKFKNIFLDEFHQTSKDTIINFVQRFNDKNKNLILSTATANKLFYLEKNYEFKAYYFNNVNKKEVKKNCYLLNEKKTKEQRLNTIKNLIENGNKVILFYENNKKQTELFSEVLKELYPDWNIELFNSENKPNSFNVKEKTILLCTSSLISGANLYLENENLIPTYVIYDSNSNLDTITQITGRFRNQKECNIIYVNKLDSEYDLKPIVTDKQVCIKNILSITNFALLKKYKDLKYIVSTQDGITYNDLLYVIDIYNKSNNKISSKEFIDIMEAKVITNKKLVTKNELETINNNDNMAKFEVTQENLGSEVSINDIELALSFYFNEKQKENIVKYFSKNKIENCLPINWIKEKTLLDKVNEYRDTIKNLDLENEIKILYNYEKDLKEYSYVQNNRIFNTILNKRLLCKYLLEVKAVRKDGKNTRYYFRKFYYEPFIEFFLSEVVNLDKETIRDLVG